MLLPRDEGAARLAIAQSGAMLAALAVLVAFASRSWRRWPRPRDLAIAVFGNAVMSAVVLPLRSKEPGLSTLIEQAGAGVAIYAFVVLGLDLAGLRSLTIARLRLTVARLRAL
jgi:hypothetical protein